MFFQALLKRTAESAVRFFYRRLTLVDLSCRTFCFWNCHWNGYLIISGRRFQPFIAQFGRLVGKQGNKQQMKAFLAYFWPLFL